MYFEAQVVFIEEIATKNGTREKKTRRHFLVECDSVSVGCLLYTSPSPRD